MAKQVRARDAAVTRRQKTPPLLRQKFPLCSASSHPTEYAVGVAVLVWGASPIAQYLVTREQDDRFPFTRRFRKPRPMRLVHHGDESTSTANRLVSGDILNRESFKGS